MLGLGYLGKGENDNAKHHLNQASKMDINHQGVQIHKNFQK